MRTIISLNRKWAFAKGLEAIPGEIDGKWDYVNLPHTWNAIDGQDGEDEYWRGKGYYVKKIEKRDLPKGDVYYLEIKGANSFSDVYLNGKHLCHHDGGYSTFRVNLTESLEEKNLLVIAVDNAPSDTVYPQMADFTFYGGLYRDVNLFALPASHFDMDYYGGNGLKITPTVKGCDAVIQAEVFVTKLVDKQSIRYTLIDRDGQEIACKVSKERTIEFQIKKVNLWDGTMNPYLYSLRAELIENNIVLDTVSSKFGCRTYEITPDRGFILNGREYPLHGVSRHQDRWGIGNALLPEHHEEDIRLIREVGANSVRLAHYQHDQYFYDLCDQYGLVVWAEIPYISQPLDKGNENTISQMKELIVQNYNHPSIVVWGLSNEITVNGTIDEKLLENHKTLNNLCHTLDQTRLTTMAALSTCGIDEELIRIPDVIAYNHYFGWYGGEADMNGPWFDHFHQINPGMPIACSEYGCEALNWHTSNPVQGDYTEEYQAYYHEELIKQLFTRKFIWATYVWNMFDFGANARHEGGENGQNHKGLVTFDRKYKKDSFYAYKAWLSDEPFVHICGKRYVDRAEKVTRVTVYSNLPTVELFANGKSLGAKKAADHFFYFDVPLSKETNLVAKAGELADESFIRKVKEFNQSYQLVEKGSVLNWFDITEPEGYLSLNSKVSEIMATEQGRQLMLGFIGNFTGDGNAQTSGIKVTPGMMKLMGGFTLLRLSKMVSMAKVTIKNEDLLMVNAMLNKIKKN